MKKQITAIEQSRHGRIYSATHVLLADVFQDVDGRDEPGHDKGYCDCEQSDEAIQKAAKQELDCFAEPVIGPAKPDPLARNDDVAYRSRLALRRQIGRAHV